MKIFILFALFLLVLYQMLFGETLIKLSDPKLKGNISLEEALSKRRSVREFATTPLTLQEVSQLLWAAQGITSPWGGRTAPSAGALYPLEIYLVAGQVKNLPSGIYKYQPKDHSLLRISEGDKREEVWKAALKQPWVKNAPVIFIFTAVYQRTTQKYGERGIRYVHIETGHAAQNLLLQAVALDLVGVPVGAFYDEVLKKTLNIKEDPLYIISIGKKK
ncbi:MAG: SagB/ThcOx family dehydrogenase [Thermodesulfobacteriaceae bacterium]|nr:SagB/ThcOx family dehydrogenase [Thermodesulfobacteriaceae bacterium]MDW8136780.1 SagB/ThcOx family dehydrogenase [Thermodesulfobacterium sp.]